MDAKYNERWSNCMHSLASHRDSGVTTCACPTHAVTPSISTEVLNNIQATPPAVGIETSVSHSWGLGSHPASFIRGTGLTSRVRYPPFPPPEIDNSVSHVHSLVTA